MSLLVLQSSHRGKESWLLHFYCALDSFVCIVALRPKSTAMVMAERLDNLQTWGRLHANVIDYNYNYFGIS